VRMEDALARSANRVLICDTDAFATAIWHERYLGRRHRGARSRLRPSLRSVHPRLTLIPVRAGRHSAMANRSAGGCTSGFKTSCRYARTGAAPVRSARATARCRDPCIDHCCSVRLRRCVGRCSVRLSGQHGSPLALPRMFRQAGTLHSCSRSSSILEAFN
jgi:hypothetical protein